MHWLPLACAVTGICFLVYATVQQNYRQGLNDPQIQMVEDAAHALKNGAELSDIVPPNTPIFDAVQSLRPFIIIFDATGKPVESTASIGEAPPKPPRGVFTYAATRGEDRVTWQPNVSTRIALVIKAVGSSPEMYVAAGRNMREVEAREKKLSLFTLLAWLVIMIATFILELVNETARRRTINSV